MHCSAFHKVLSNATSVIYPYDENLPKVIINPALDISTSHQIGLFPLSCSSTEYNLQSKPNCSPKTIVSCNNQLIQQKKEIYNKSIVSVKNSIENTKEFAKAIGKYQLLEKSTVLCLRCQNNVNMVDCFNYRDCAYICLKCASQIFASITQLKDWEKRESTNNSKSCYRCDRLKHSKELYSFIKYSMKKNKYELCSLCLYCRNVKKCEYLMKKRFNRMMCNKTSLFY